MPTTNLIPPTNKLLPLWSISSRTIIDGLSYPGMTNIGYRPTVSDDSINSVETYIYDYDGDLYDHDIIVELLTYVRPEIKFDTIEGIEK